MNGIVLVTANVAARYGVMGAEIPLSPTPEMVQSLADMTVVVTDGSGAKLTRENGNALLGSPLNVATWISLDLAVSGTRLKAGDLISVGSFSPLTPQATADGEGPIHGTFEGPSRALKPQVLRRAKQFNQASATRPGRTSAVTHDSIMEMPLTRATSSRTEASSMSVKVRPPTSRSAVPCLNEK